jgi:hypothetical protein
MFFEIFGLKIINFKRDNLTYTCLLEYLKKNQLCKSLLHSYFKRSLDLTND